MKWTHPHWNENAFFKELINSCTWCEFVRRWQCSFGEPSSTGTVLSMTDKAYKAHKKWKKKYNLNLWLKNLIESKIMCVVTTPQKSEHIIFSCKRQLVFSVYLFYCRFNDLWCSDVFRCCSGVFINRRPLLFHYLHLINAASLTWFSLLTATADVAWGPLSLSICLPPL